MYGRGGGGIFVCLFVFYTNSPLSYLRTEQQSFYSDLPTVELPRICVHTETVSVGEVVIGASNGQHESIVNNTGEYAVTSPNMGQYGLA